MTGTPIENNLIDLFSLFDFSNKGLFGRLEDFKKSVKGLEGNPEELQAHKDDGSAVHAAQIKNGFGACIGFAGQDRDSRIHRHFTKTIGSLWQGAEACRAILCQTIYENRERVLVFTQYRELTEPLAEYLQTIFKAPGRILHGGVPAKKRAEIVEKFNSPDEYVPLMVLSLKAGGVGLNLTAANHVVYFDRWWNPAVEDQATDMVDARIENLESLVRGEFPEELQNFSRIWSMACFQLQKK